MLKFNHDTKTIQDSLGIDSSRADHISANILFEIINQAYLVKNLFDSPENAPSNLTTKTGLLERVFEETTNEAERIYATWEYSKIDLTLQKSETMQATLQGMALLYSACDSDKDKFINKFIEHKSRMGGDDDDEN